MNTINASEIKGDIPEGATHYNIGCFYKKPFKSWVVHAGDWVESESQHNPSFESSILEIIYDTDKPYVPEVGDECEARVKKLKITPFNKWSKCSFIAKNTGSNGQYQYIVKDCNGNAAILYEEDGVEFRPIQSEEDKLRDWIDGLRPSLLDAEQWSSQELMDIFTATIAGALNDLGIKAPEGEQ